jgi:hypothetical protein
MTFHIQKFFFPAAWLLLAAQMTGCGRHVAKDPVTGPQFVAYSLRQADELLARGSTDDAELRSLGGITRFVGMVFDREGKDVILVGRVCKDLPPATLDDLAVALRCRLLKGGYPRVSIDMVEDSAKTGMQAVRTQGGIDQTQFGADFIDSDVVLKRYSLDLLARIPGINPYLSLYESDARKRLAAQGHEVKDARWLSEKESQEAIARHLGQRASDSHVVQNRFWFRVRDDQSYIVEKDDVFVIEELRLGVKTETMVNSTTNVSKGKNHREPDLLGQEFARQFTAGYQEALAQHRPLKRLKVLFDMVCIAEGIAHLGESKPALDHLLHGYRVQAAATPTQYPIIHRVGEFRAKDGASLLAEVSGGIDLDAVLLALEDGDVNGLKLAVLKTRPDQHRLCWPLPLEEWKMPNSQGIQEPPKVKVAKAPTDKPPRQIGSAITVQQFVFDPTSANPAGPVFNGFPPPPPVETFGPDDFKYQLLDKLRPGGVSMRLKLNNSSFQRAGGAGLKLLQQNALKDRPATNALSWPIPPSNAPNGTKPK